MPNLVHDETTFQSLVRFSVLPFAGVDTLQIGSATPSVKNLNTWIAGNVAPVTITNFLDASDNQTITILGDGFTSVANNTKIQTNTALTKLLLLNRVYVFIYMKGKWYESYQDIVTFNVQHYGASSVGDSTQAVLNTYAAATAYSLANGAARVIWPTGNYNVNDSILLNTHRIHTVGYGLWASHITFNPTSAKALFLVQNSNPALVNYQCSFYGLSFSGAGVQQKIIFDLWDNSEVLIENFTIATLNGNSGSTLTPSIGLRTHGREVLTVRRYEIFADRPIHFMANPNSTPNEATDHYHFEDGYVAAQVATEACHLLDANIAPSNITFDGYQAWIGGKYGLDYTAGGTTGVAAIMATFNNIRYEQSADPTGYAVRWQGQSTQNLAFNSCYFGGGNNNGGALVRNTARLTFYNCTYSGNTGVAYDFATNDQVWFINTFAQVGSTINAGTLEEVFSPSPKAGSGQPIPGTVYYCNPALNAIIAIRIGGTYKYCYKGLVANGGNLPLPLLTVGNGLKTASVIVSGYSTVGPAQVGGQVTATAVATTLESGSIAVGNTPGKLCVFFNTSGNPMILLNNTGQAMYVTVDVTANYG